MIKIIVICLAAMLLSSATAMAAERADFEPDPVPEFNWRGSYFEVIFGGDYRIDETAAMRSPTAKVGVLYWLSIGAALRTELGYNHAFSYGHPDEEYRTWLLDVGVRFQRHEKFLSPFLDLGIAFLKYSSPNDRLDDNSFKTGLSAEIGTSIRVSRRINLDLSIHHIADHVPEQVVYHPSDLPHDIGPDPFPGFGGSFGPPDALFNPASFEFQVRMGL